jgi:hypothetical protein
MELSEYWELLVYFRMDRGPIATNCGIHSQSASLLFVVVPIHVWLQVTLCMIMDVLWKIVVFLD